MIENKIVSLLDQLNKVDRKNITEYISVLEKIAAFFSARYSNNSADLCIIYERRRSHFESCLDTHSLTVVDFGRSVQYDIQRQDNTDMAYSNLEVALEFMCKDIIREARSQRESTQQAKEPTS